MRDGNNVNYDIDSLTNRYDSVGGNNLTYDAAGNLTKDKNGYTYHYDYENRLLKIKKSNDTVTVVEFTYDALGRRIEKKDSITSANTRRYYYNYNWQILSEFDGSGGYKKSYIYGNYIDEVLMSVVSAIASTHKYYLHDHLSSPVALTDNDGVVVERYEYDAYGKCYILEPNFAPDPDGKPDVGNPFMFTGRELDILDNGNLKIQYNRNRYYDYYTGRWLTHDPLGYIDGMNLYEYVGSEPTGNLDAFGTYMIASPLTLPRIIPLPKFLPIGFLWPTINLDWTISGKGSCNPTGSTSVSIEYKSPGILTPLGDVTGSLDISGSYGRTTDTYATCNSKYKPWVWTTLTKSLKLSPLSDAQASIFVSGVSPSASAGVGIAARVYPGTFVDFGVYAASRIGVRVENKKWVGGCKCMKTVINANYTGTQRSNLAPATAVATVAAIWYVSPAIIAPIVEKLVEILERAVPSTF